MTAGEMTKACGGRNHSSMCCWPGCGGGVEGNSECQWLQDDTPVLELAHNGTLTLIRGAQEEWDLWKFMGESPGGPGVKKTRQFYSGGPGSIPDLRTKIPQAAGSAHPPSLKRMKVMIADPGLSLSSRHMMVSSFQERLLAVQNECGRESCSQKLQQQCTFLWSLC